MAKIFFAKYKMLDNHTNYFDIVDPTYGDKLTITKQFETPRLSKQLSSPIDLSQIQYGDADILISTLNSERSEFGLSITEFFQELHDNSTRVIKCLCIIDNDTARWAGFVYLPIDYNNTFYSSGMTIKLKVFDAMVEWMNFAKGKVPENAPLDSNTPFREYMSNYVMNDAWLDFRCEFIPWTRPGNTGIEAVFNTRLMLMLLAGGNKNFSTYTFVKGLCQEWGLVYRFEVPADYETAPDRVRLVFRIMERSEGKAFTLRVKGEIVRTQLPKITEPYVLLLNRRYTLTSHLSETHDVVWDIGHGILINQDTAINTDQYPLYVAGDEPANCFIFSIKDTYGTKEVYDPAYKDLLTVQLNGAVTQRIPMADVKIIETEMYNIYTRSSFGLGDPVDEYMTFKFGVYPSNWNNSLANVVTDNKISVSRLFTETYYLYAIYFMHDNTGQLNENRSAALRVLLKNNKMLKCEITLGFGEPDLFDYCDIEYEGNIERYSANGLEIDSTQKSGELLSLKIN